jgi:O-antigen/teichoic acid export membrane protein
MPSDDLPQPPDDLMPNATGIWPPLPASYGLMRDDGERRDMSRASWPDIWVVPGVPGVLEAAPDLSTRERPITAGPSWQAGSGLAPPRGGKSSDLARLARGSLINFVGAFMNALFGFVLVLVVTHGLHRGRAGVFFEAVALFTILSNIAELGADDGLVRMIPRYRALGRTQDIRRTLAVSLWPVLGVGALFAAATYVYAPQLSHFFVRGDTARAGALVPYIRTLAPFLPLSAVSTAILSATRGFGTMKPFVAIDNFGKPGLRPLLTLAVISAGLGSTLLALSWGGPIALGFVAALACLWWLLRRAEHQERREMGPPLPGGQLASEFWRFAAPRGLAAVFGVTVYWLDTLLLGALKSAEQAGIYTAVSRYLFVGFFALSAIQLVIAPMIAGLLTEGNLERARVVYQTATQWLMIPAWPIYFAMALFAPLLLRVFPPSYASGHTALTILSLAMLVSTATGPCVVVLLMGGKSSWTLINSVVSLGLNLGLNLVLIPRYGMSGAAVAWMVSILANNLAAVIELRLLLKLSPFGQGFPLVALSATVCFGGLGLLTRLTLGMSLPAFLGFVVVASLLYFAILYRFRAGLHLNVMRDAVTLRAQRNGQRAAGPRRG